MTFTRNLDFSLKIELGYCFIPRYRIALFLLTPYFLVRFRFPNRSKCTFQTDSKSKDHITLNRLDNVNGRSYRRIYTVNIQDIKIRLLLPNLTIVRWVILVLYTLFPKFLESWFAFYIILFFYNHMEHVSLVILLYFSSIKLYHYG